MPEDTPPASPAPAPRPDTDPLAGLLGGALHSAVAGLQWGDEGKGKIVDLLTPSYDYVVRYNGGANAGHSVQVGEDRYALHLIPSGILYPGKVNVLAGGVVIDPEQVILEIDQLGERGIDVTDNLRISDRSHLVLPYHKEQDRLLESALSHQRGDGQRIGTTGRGIGPCYADKAQRSTALRMGDLVDEAGFRDKLRHIVAIKNLLLQALAGACDEHFEPIDGPALAEQYLAFGRRLCPYICDTSDLLQRAMRGRKRILFEGANATLLDIDHGTFPFVTSSNCSALGVHTGAGVPGRQLQQVLGIIKAYTTRVGGGPMPTELQDADGERLRTAGKEFGTTTGRPRRCGWLDLVAAGYAARISGATHLAIMLLDVLSGFEQVKICTGYRVAGERLETFPADAAVLESVEPIYETIEGFSEPIDTCRRLSDLPPAARRYLDRIEEALEIPVALVSVGPRRDQTIVR